MACLQPKWHAHADTPIPMCPFTHKRRQRGRRPEYPLWSGLMEHEYDEVEW
ncbi:hypothetical protein JB92DRAFT_2947005, partial [Gautieria morchelliformis]